MLGTIRINLIVAAVAGLLTFVLSIGNNLFLTTCLKSFYSFMILFVLTFGFRWVLGLLVGLDHSARTIKDADQALDSHLGSNLDLTTPEEEDETRQMLKGNPHPSGAADSSETQFSPLNPPKLVTKNNLDPEQLAGALRQLSED